MNHRLFVAPRAPVEEPTAVLVYGEDRFEIPYTLMHWLTGVLAQGIPHSGIGIQILANAKAPFEFVSAAMCWDASPPDQTTEHSQMLKRIGYNLDRPAFKLPYPAITEYEEGHVPQPNVKMRPTREDWLEKSLEHAGAALATAETLLDAELGDEDRSRIRAVFNEQIKNAQLYRKKADG